MGSRRRHPSAARRPACSCRGRARRNRVRFRKRRGDGIRIAVARPLLVGEPREHRVVGCDRRSRSSDAPRTSPMITSTRETRGLSPWVFFASGSRNVTVSVNRLPFFGRQGLADVGSPRPRLRLHVELGDEVAGHREDAPAAKRVEHAVIAPSACTYVFWYRPARNPIPGRAASV